jgi:hypothetical protein
MENVKVSGYRTPKIIDFIERPDKTLMLLACDNRPILIKYDARGNVLWSKRFENSTIEYGNGTLLPNDDNTVFFFSEKGETDKIVLHCIMDDFSIRSKVEFAYSLPTKGEKSNYHFTALETPSGMSLSPDGAIRWTPAGDSSYVVPVSIAVTDAQNRTDTLAFNIRVNDITSAVKGDVTHRSRLKGDAIRYNCRSQVLTLSLNGDVRSAALYTVQGRMVRRIQTNGKKTITWNMRHEKLAPGRYIVALEGRAGQAVQPLLITP